MPNSNEELNLLKQFQTLFSVKEHASFDLNAQIQHIHQIEQFLPSGVGLYLLDLHDFRYAYMSERSSSITGIAPSDYEEHGLSFFFEHLHPEDRKVIAEKTLPMYKKQLEACEPTKRKQLNASLNYRIRSCEKGMQPYRHVHAQLSIRSVNAQSMPVLLLGVFSELAIEQYQGQDFKLYLAREGAVQEVLVDERITVNPLTAKEVEVLTKLAEGLSSKAVADQLFISKHTVDTHRRKIISKLEVTNSIEAVIYARSMGWI